MQFCKNFTASGQKMEGFQGRKFFAREPTGFPARRPSAAGIGFFRNF